MSIRFRKLPETVRELGGILAAVLQFTMTAQSGPPGIPSANFDQKPIQDGERARVQ
jgi:hypothetical protein